MFIECLEFDHRKIFTSFDENGYIAATRPVPSMNAGRMH